MKNICTILLILVFANGFSQPGTIVPKNPTPVKPVKTTTQPKPKPNPQPASTSNYPVGTIILEVDFETLPCENNETKTCLLIRQKGKSEYEIYNNPIEGFKYEPGNSYTIAVNTNSQGLYTLHSVISKKFVQYSNTPYNPPKANETPAYTPVKPVKTASANVYNSPLDKKWYLRTIVEDETTSIQTENNNYWIEFNSWMDRFKGHATCSDFEGIFKSDLSTLFKVDQLNIGSGNCGLAKAQDIFAANLQAVDRFEIVQGRLQLSKQWKVLLIFDSNPNSDVVATEEVTTEEATVEDAAEEVAAEEIITEVPVDTLYPDKNEELEKLKKEVEELKKQIQAKEANITQQTSNSTIIIPNQITQEPGKIYYKSGENLIPLDKADASFINESKKPYYLITSPRSKLRFNSKNIPKLIIQLNDINKEPIDIYVLSMTKSNINNRQFITNEINADTKNSIVNFGYKKIKPGVFELAFIGNLEDGEYSFINATANTSTTNQVYTLGIDP